MESNETSAGPTTAAIKLPKIPRREQLPDTPEPKYLPLLSEEEQKKRWEAIMRTDYGRVFNRLKFDAEREFGEMMAVQLTQEMMGIPLMETVAYLQATIREAGEVAASKDPKIKDEARMVAAMVVSNCSSKIVELTKEMRRIYRAATRQEQKPPVGRNRGPAADFMVVAQNVQITGQQDAKNGGDDAQVKRLPQPSQ